MIGEAASGLDGDLVAAIDEGDALADHRDGARRRGDLRSGGEEGGDLRSGRVGLRRPARSLADVGIGHAGFRPGPGGDVGEEGSLERARDGDGRALRQGVLEPGDLPPAQLIGGLQAAAARLADRRCVEGDGLIAGAREYDPVGQ